MLAGSHLVQAAIGERIDNEALGGAEVQSDVSGVVDHRHPDDESCLKRIRSQLEQLARTEKAPFARREAMAPRYDAEEIGGGVYSGSVDKAARFTQLCNQKQIPLIFLQNVTGLIVGGRAEHGGIIKDGAKWVNAVANTVVKEIRLFTTLEVISRPKTCRSRSTWNYLESSC